MAFQRIRLERARRRALGQMAAHPDRGIHGRDRALVHNCVRQCRRRHDSGAFVSRGANSSNATTLGYKLHHAGSCWLGAVWLAGCAQPFANKTAARRDGPGQRSAEPKIRSAIHRANFRPVHATERGSGALKSAARFADLAGERLPGPVLEDEETYRFVMNFSASNKTDLLLGTIDVEDGREYNAAALVSTAGRQVQIYRKLHLVPFGEYIPLRHSFPLFAAVAGRWVPGDFDRGSEYTTFHLRNRDIKVAPLICFEDTIGELTRQFVLRGANLLVDVTNDAWFLRSAGSQQHLSNAVFRCIETRRPMARAANTGVTCFVNEFGRVTQILRDDTGSTFTEGVLIGEINVPQEPALSASRTGRQPTFYTRHGELFAKICAGVTALAILILLVGAKIGRAGSPEPPPTRAMPRAAGD